MQANQLCYVSDDALGAIEEKMKEHAEEKIMEFRGVAKTNRQASEMYD